ncbi:MAG: coenzyme F420-0:L-glutamate ligase [bacterium]
MRSCEPTVREVGGCRYLRIPVRTHVVTEKDDIADVVERYVDGKIRPGDWLVVSESVTAITQGRAIPEDRIRVGPLARLLWRGVKRVSYGVGLRSPLSMQCAIDECGRMRILLAAAVGLLTKLIGRSGDFYRVAGMQAALIDGAHTSSVQPYDRCVIKGPLHPDREAQRIKERVGVDTAIMDINDIGGSWAIGYTDGIDKTLIEEIMRDNPMGQESELTPICIIRIEYPSGGEE